MGIRADFYVRKEKVMTWLGSIADDGYPDGIDEDVLKSQTQEEFESNVKEFLSKEESATLPENGWPWPWNDSRTTDYSYIFEGGKVMASCFGYSLFDPLVLDEDEEEDEEDNEKLKDYFPDMSEFKNVAIAGNKRSGVIVFTVPK